MQAVIIAGGKGRRLRPFTTTVPKPLFPVGEKPIIQIIIEQLREAGVTKFVISVGHLGQLIEAYLGNGAQFGCAITYVRESEPLGTAGPLGLLEKMSDDFIFMNGDILASVDYRKAVHDHKARAAMMTICTFEKRVKSSLGVLDIDPEHRVRNYIEKPEVSQTVSTGVYIMNPGIQEFVVPGEHVNIPELVMRLIHQKKTVFSWEITGHWFDIGTPEDLENALKFLEGTDR